MKCPKCGKEIQKKGAKFCPHCGAKLDVSGDAPKQQKTAKKPEEDRKKAESSVHGTGNNSEGTKINPIMIGGVVLFVLAIILLGKSCGGKKEASVDSTAVETTTDQNVESQETTENTQEVQENNASEAEDYEETYEDSEDSSSEDASDDTYDDSEDTEDGGDSSDSEYQYANSEKYINEYYELCNEIESNGEVVDIRSMDLPDGLTSDQKKELKKIYEEFYNDEKQFLPAAVEETVQNYDKDEETRESWLSMKGTMENAYQAINEFDPNLKDVVADDVATRYTDSPLSYYLVDQGIGTILADNELGQEIRSGIEDVGLNVLAAIAIWSDHANNTTRKDAMMPVVVGENYALVRTLGTISELLYEVESLGSYDLRNEVYQARQEALNDYFGRSSYLFSQCVDATPDNLYDRCVWAEKQAGRQQALDEAIENTKQEEIDYKTVVLNKLGITDEKEVNALLDLEVDEGDDVDDDEAEKAREEADNLRYSLGGQYLYSIVDKDGNTYGSFLSTIDSTRNSATAGITKDGMVSLGIGDVNSDDCVHNLIISREGKELFRNEEKDENGNKSRYYNVTPSGNILHKTFLNDYDHGDYQVLELVKPDGTTKKLLESGSIQISDIGNTSDREDNWFASFSGELQTKYYWYKCSYEDQPETEQEGYIDMETGELLTEEEYQEANPQAVSEDESYSDEENQDPKMEILRNGTWLNDDYILYEDIIYDKDGEKVASVEEGRGVNDILYANDHYWIVTRSGWYYVLDDKFEKTMEPVQFKSDQTYKLTPYGLMMRTDPNPYDDNDDDEGDEDKFELYDENGEVVLYLPGNIYIDRDVYGFIVGNNQVGWANLNTKESMLLSLPEGDVDVITYDQLDYDGYGIYQ
nr:zinc ribbon domain-containing protein [uncultured Blautia sp.]